MKKLLVLVVGLVALLFVATVSMAGKQDGSKRSSAVTKQKKTFDAHRQYVKIHFNDDEMDFALQWVLGSISQGGCEIGEAFYVVGNIKDGDPKSWQKQWGIMAKRTESRADKSLLNLDKVSARDAYMRASNYYRTAIVSMFASDPRFKRWATRSRDCLRAAGELFNPPMRYFEIPFEGTVMPGYFWPAKRNGKARTLILIGGGETHIEDNYFYIAAQAHKRGYNFVTIDIPGQGMLPLYEKFYRPETEVTLGLLMDYVLKQPEVIPQKVGMYGISGGGYFVPRAATVDKRIKAIAVNSAIVDQGKAFAKMPIAQATPKVLASWQPFHRQTAGVVAWRWGLDTSNVIGLVDANRAFFYDPSKITCPALVLIGEGEYANEEIRKQQKWFIDSVNNDRKRFVVTPANQGASSHCIGENRAVMSEVVFRWFDEVFR